VTFRIFTEPQQGASYDQLLAVAQTAEQCGFDAFFRSDHFLKMGDASGLPATTDAWTTLAGLARDTSSIRLGTLVTPVTFRPIGTFSAIAAEVDHMSGGRLEVGLGSGWYGQEHEAFGLPFPELKARYDLLEDQLELLHGLWSAASGATVEISGRTGSFSVPADTVRPHQRPGPPIVLGGQGGPRSARLAATYAAEYNTGFVPSDYMKSVHDKVRTACEGAGRDPSTMVWSIALVVCVGATDAEVARRAKAIGRDVDELKKNGLAGSPAEVVDKIAAYKAAGAERFYLQVLDVGDLDHLRFIAAEIVAFA
jgi:alkanesulfonate monooxygenase SsuD/methylene tetrahydromethanopterin reductase-like flavin-dependent oxidoreductase (luciferase family)